MVAVLSILFLLSEALPSDHADIVAGADRSRAQEIREQQGLDRPVLLRLAAWWAHALTGDLGRSLVDGQPVLPRVLGALSATAVVAVPAALLAVAGAVSVAFSLAWWGDRSHGVALSVLTAIVAGLPEAVLVIALVLAFSVQLQLVPAVSLVDPFEPLLAQPEVLVLPILGLAIPHAAWGAKLLRGSAADIVGGDLVSSARTRGVTTLRIARTLVLPRWRGPVLQAIAFLVAGTLGGSAVIESMLAYSGIGEALVAAVSARDTAMVQGIGAVVVAISLTLLVLADLLVELPDRFGER